MTQHPKQPLIALFFLAILSVVYITAIAPRLGFAVLYAPQTDSLQPLPESVGPNLQENIQSRDAVLPEFTASEEGSRANGDPEQEESNAIEVAEQTESAQNNSESEIFFWLTSILVICLAALSWWTYKSTSRSKKLE